KAYEYFLFPEAKPSAIEIGTERLFGCAAILPAISQVKGVTRTQERVFFCLQRPFEDGGVLAVFIGIQAARALDAHLDVETGCCARRKARRSGDEFVENAEIAKFQMIAANLSAMMVDRPMPNRDIIKVGVQLCLEHLRAKSLFADENIIRVND